MKHPLLALAALAFAAPLAAQEAEPPTPASVVAEAPASDWRAIDPADLLVMTLAPDANGNPRTVVIQLIPPPFSQGWTHNIRTLAKAHWWDGTSVYRVVDNWVAQWGDGEDDEEKAKPLPEGLRAVPESEYLTKGVPLLLPPQDATTDDGTSLNINMRDSYAFQVGFLDGWPLGATLVQSSMPVFDKDTGKPVTAHLGRHGQGYRYGWPVHCYATVGVARDLSPDTGTGAELYAVIGHAPRQLDRNIAVVGRVIEGIEHLSTLPRGKGEAGVYDDPALRVPIVSIRLGDELPEADPASSSEAVGQQTRPRFEYLGSETDSFARYVEVRANRNDAFYKVPAGGVDVCNVQVPIRRVQATQ